MLTAWGLPAEKAVAASERIDALAKAAKCGGDPRTLDQLRIDRPRRGASRLEASQQVSRSAAPTLPLAVVWSPQPP
jgi:hypothetical protein